MSPAYSGLARGADAAAWDHAKGGAAGAGTTQADPAATAHNPKSFVQQNSVARPQADRAPCPAVWAERGRARATSMPPPRQVTAAPCLLCRHSQPRYMIALLLPHPRVLACNRASHSLCSVPPARSQASPYHLLEREAYGHTNQPTCLAKCCQTRPRKPNLGSGPRHDS
jgi:hypothetical protein